MASVAVSRGLVFCKEFQRLQLRSRNISRIRCQSGFSHQEKLHAAVDVVQRACQLCTSLKGREGQLDKKDNSPVTVADFGVQALVSLELGRLFPGIPLVSEENTSALRKSKASPLVDTIVNALSPLVSPLVSRELDCETVLDAIDRGAKAGTDEQSYWVLDPIDGTRGFLRGGDALYVVGLALVVDGKPVLGVMGCPNVAIRYSADRSVIQMAKLHDEEKRGLIMAASLGGGCWVKPLNEGGVTMIQSRVDASDSLFCISDNEDWTTSPLARALASKKHGDVQVLPLCCGSLCKYLAVALGGVSAFLLQTAPTRPLKAWDHAAGVICVSEAGGQVSDLEGTPLEHLVGNGKEAFTVEGGGIFASNKALHHLLTDIRNQTAVVGP